MSGGAELDSARAEELRQSFSRHGLMTAFGASIERAARGECVLTVPMQPSLTQQHGFFHGGVIGALADTAGGYAAASLQPAGSDVLTLDYTVHFLRPAAGEKLIAEGKVVRAGRSVTVTRIDVFAVRDGQKIHCAAMQQSIAPAPRQHG